MRKPPFCPRCRAKPVRYIELWKGHTITFGTDDAGKPDEEGSLGEGEPCAVVAVCACGKQWNVWGARQITDITRTFSQEPTP